MASDDSQHILTVLGHPPHSEHRALAFAILAGVMAVAYPVKRLEGLEYGCGQPDLRRGRAYVEKRDSLYMHAVWENGYLPTTISSIARYMYNHRPSPRCCQGFLNQLSGIHDDYFPPP